MIKVATVHCRQQIIDRHDFYMSCRETASAILEQAWIAG